MGLAEIFFRIAMTGVIVGCSLTILVPLVAKDTRMGDKICVIGGCLILVGIAFAIMSLLVVVWS